MVGRAVLTAVNDGAPIQELQIRVLADESLDRVPRFQNFGFSSVPPSGVQAIVLSVGGSRAGSVVVATEAPGLRPTGWAEGESGLYNAEGSIAVLRAAGKFEVNNGEQDLVTVISDFLQWVQEAKVITAIGPQPFDPPTLLAAAELKERLDTFKV